MRPWRGIIEGSEVVQVRDLNASGVGVTTSETAGATSQGALGAGVEAPEIAFLRARIEHLEVVIETARGLMTSNQERLLRRLHDIPREIATLAARMDAPAREAVWEHG